MSQKVEKVHNFLDVLDFFEFGKNRKFEDPPPLPNLGKIRNLENFESEKNISLKHLKLPKNHFKTFFFWKSLTLNYHLRKESFENSFLV